MSVALIGPHTARGEAVLNALTPLAKAIDVIGLATSEAVGASYTWQGDQAARALDDADLGAVDAVLCATPDVAPRDGTPWLSLCDGPLPVLADALRPAQRIADPIARVVAALVDPLADRLTGLDLTVADSASVVGRVGMDELRDQTISLLNFRPLPTAVFDRRLAFDLLVDDTTREAALSADLAAVCPQAPTAEVRRMVVPTFIGTAIDLRLRGAVDLADVLGRLEALQIPVGPSGLAEVTEAGALHAVRPAAVADGVRLWLLVDDLQWGVARAALDFLARIRSSAV